MRKVYIILALIILSLGYSDVALADDITADVLTYDGKSKMVTAVGNVVIHANQGATITGKRGQYNFIDRSAWIDGGIRYEKEQTIMTADKMYLYKDKTVRGVGSVYMNDEKEKRTLKGNDVMYNNDTGFGKINGNGYLETIDGIMEAPLIEGNMKQVKIVASGGVRLSSVLHQMTGNSDEAVYTRTGQKGLDGKLTLIGNAHVIQNGNTFDGPELVMRDAEKVVETTGRSTIVITNTESSPIGADSGKNDESTDGNNIRVTKETPIVGKPDYADEMA